MTQPWFKPGQPAEFVSAEEGYDRWAEIYDQEDNPLIALEQPRMAALIGDVAGLSVLDLGCGTGRWSVALAGGGAKVTALDVSEKMMARLRSKPGSEAIRLVHHSLADPLPLADGTFDRVVCALVLEHIADLHLFFGECRRVCRPGGLMIASAMHPAMMLRGISAHYRDPKSGLDICPESRAHQISDFVMAALRSGWHLDHLSEHAVDDALAERSSRAAKYLGWPMLVLIRLSPASRMP